ncbi:hypothetical protein [Calothrix sp. UHCC 0171]|uniref:hypothetical protein n=1 Tax=Calothrix sp. UHCC 0171 TaxID=3110245 RepID=UPI002B1EF146|nr:hypothetical protein [Calothrix sp. UHCC 0171]MEA5571432.1 hypothetical protein [Calothrix sp. UHCC 0171]
MARYTVAICAIAHNPHNFNNQIIVTGNADKNIITSSPRLCYAINASVLVGISH